MMMFVLYQQHIHGVHVIMFLPDPVTGNDCASSSTWNGNCEVSSFYVDEVSDGRYRTSFCWGVVLIVNDIATPIIPCSIEICNVIYVRSICENYI